MDQPLFGEQKKSTKCAIWLTAIVVIGFIVFTIICCVIMGFVHHNYSHFVFAAAVLLLFVNVALLFLWWNAGDLDPKFNYLMLLLVVTVIFVAMVANVYIWPDPPQAWPSCTDTTGFVYYAGTAQCLTKNVTLCSGLSCLRWIGNGAQRMLSCSLCNSTTVFIH